MVQPEYTLQIKPAKIKPEYIAVQASCYSTQVVIHRVAKCYLTGQRSLATLYQLQQRELSWRK